MCGRVEKQEHLVGIVVIGVRGNGVLGRGGSSELRSGHILGVFCSRADRIWDALEVKGRKRKQSPG